jgi:hypothetical protein
MCDNSDSIIEFELIIDLSTEVNASISLLTSDHRQMMISDHCVMMNTYIDERNIKLFFLLLKESIDNLIDNNIVYLQQYINKSDFELISHLDWEIISEKNNVILIQCDINKSLENIGSGLGFDNKI